MENAKQDDIALKVDTALYTIEKTNPALKGALPDNYYSRLHIDRNKLSSLLDEIDKINTDDKETLKELRDITKDKGKWKRNIEFVGDKLDENYSNSVKAKALWLLGEMGLNYPNEIEEYLSDIVGYLEDDDSKLRERSVNALGRIGRADKNLIVSYMDKLMKMRYDESENVRHAFIWACENIATNAPELFCEKLDIFYEMISDYGEKVRIEAPEIFRVIGI